VAGFGCVVRVGGVAQWRITHQSLTLCVINPHKFTKHDQWTKRKRFTTYDGFGQLADGIEEMLRTYKAHLDQLTVQQKPPVVVAPPETDESFSIRQDAITRSDLELVDGDELRIIINTAHSTQAIQLSPARTVAFLQKALDVYRELMSKQLAQNPFK
jgi:hypothetical protein